MPFAIWPAVSLQHQRREEGRTRRVSEGSPRPSAPGVTLVKTKGKFGRTSCRSRRLGNRRRIPSICLFAIWPAVSLQHQRGEEGRTRRVSEGSPRPSAPGVTLVKTKGKFGRTSCRSRRLGNRRRIPSIGLSRFGRRCPFSTKEEKRVVRDESRKDPPGRPRRG